MGYKLEELAAVAKVSQSWSHGDLVKLFAWHLHTDRNQEHFTAAQVGSCYEKLHLDKPTAFGPYVAQLEKRRDILRSAAGLRLSKAVRDDLAARYSFHPITVITRAALMNLPATVPSVEEREFLSEALICYGSGANRAAVVMTWNLTYDHLLHFVLAHHLADFNTNWPKRFPKEHRECKVSAMAKLDDFTELKESIVIEICRSSGIITADVFKVLKQSLDTRNSAAHPSSFKVKQVDVEAYISTTVHNVVLALKV